MLVARLKEHDPPTRLMSKQSDREDNIYHRKPTLAGEVGSVSGSGSVSGRGGTGSIFASSSCCRVLGTGPDS